jgi:hypothetical protein
VEVEVEVGVEVVLVGRRLRLSNYFPQNLNYFRPY